MPSILTTESVPPPRRAEYWEEMVTRQFVPVRCLTDAHSPFSARIRSLDVGSVKLCDVRSQGTDVLRTAAHVARSDEPYFLLSQQVAGTGRLDHAGRTVTLQPGDLVLYDTARVYELNFAAEQRQLVLRIPHRSLLARCQDIESRVGIRIPGALPAARLIGDLGRQLVTLDGLPSGRSQASLAATLVDLVVDGLLGIETTAPPRRGAVRLADAQRLARQGLADPDFSVARWAQALAISERYLRLLFKPTLQSPAQYLWTQRLERAAAALRDPAGATRSVTDIALGCGFSDSAHFSHAFRTAYSCSPSQYRRGGDVPA